MKPNIIIISTSRADRHLLSPIAEKLGDECEFIKSDPATWECCRSTLNKGDIGKKVVLLGDRWETLLLAFRASELNCLTYHIHGGEVTAGSKDEMYRHAITKLSQVHLAAHQDFADRCVIRMGEDPNNVFSTGSIGVWRAKKFMEKAYIKKGKKLSVILHPNTIEPDKTEQECLTLLQALGAFSDHVIDFYAPNHDSGRDIIERKFKAFCEVNSNCYYFEEKEADYFLGSLAKSLCLIGNSSCGIIEAPSLKTPTVNIGSRQDGRPMAKSVLNVDFNSGNIFCAIKTTLNCSFNFKNPYDNVEHDTVDMICDIIRNHPVEFGKRFFD